MFHWNADMEYFKSLEHVTCLGTPILDEVTIRNLAILAASSPLYKSSIRNRLVKYGLNIIK